MAAIQQDQTPGVVTIRVVTGDDLLESTCAVTADGSAVTLTASLAQVRANASPSSPVLMTLTSSEAAGTVTYGGDTVSLDPGTYYWDLQTTSTELGVLTVIGGQFVVLPGVSA